MAETEMVRVKQMSDDERNVVNMLSPQERLEALIRAGQTKMHHIDWRLNENELNPNQYSITVYPYIEMPMVIDRFVVPTKEEALERLAKWCDAEKYSNVSLRDDRGYVVKEWASDPQTQKEIDALRDMHREYKGISEVTD